MIRKIYSSRAQVSMEFSILVVAVIVGATIVGYYMLKSAIVVKDTNVDIIEKTSNITMKVLKTVN
jgi:uncharacterized protein (UPF0333 family)